MANAHQRNKQKKLQRARRRRNERDRQGAAAPGKRLSRKLADKLADAHESIEGGRLAEAEKHLDLLDQQHPGCAEIAEVQLYLYQQTGDHEECCAAAKRLVKLRPRDAFAYLMYAQESLYCGRLAIARSAYRLFLERWPDDEHAPKARKAIAVLEPELKSAVRTMGIDPADSDLLILHDEVLELMQHDAFDQAAQKCLALLRLAPKFLPARNNLALCYFQNGNPDKAVHAAEETRELAPENRFAQANVGKLWFLSGRISEAHSIADQVVADPPTEADPLAAATELLSLLGRDRDVVRLVESADDQTFDPRCRAVLMHHLAVAQFRLGDEKQARRTWRKCLKAMPSHPTARQNLRDLDEGAGHAPWAEPLTKWIPKAVLEQLRKRGEPASEPYLRHFAKRFPAMPALIPELLDRGDPMGRELAMHLAAEDASPPMLEALRRFALSARGPDAMRQEALSILVARGAIDAGPQRFYCRGKWSDVNLFTAEISWEPNESLDPRVQQSMESGIEALRCDELDSAETSFNEVLEYEPDNPTAVHNLCAVWLRRDGASGRRRAQVHLQKLREQFPDYFFASTTLARVAVRDGDLDRASELLAPLRSRKKMHGSEAIALFGVDIEIALKRGQVESAEQIFEMLKQVAGEHHPTVLALRRRIDTVARRGGLLGLLSRQR